VIKVQAIILAAGKGSRFHNLTKTIPKCLLNIGNTTILDRQIDLLLENNVDEIFVVTGHQSDLIQKHLNKKNVKIIKNKKYKFFDNLYSFWCVKNFITNDFICIYGDLVFDKKLLLEIIKNKNNCLIVDDPTYEFDNHSVEIKNNLIKNINFNYDILKHNGQFIGILKFNKSSLSLLKKSINVLEKNNNLDGEFIRLIKSLINNKMIIHAHCVNKKIWINVNDKINLDDARKQFN
jgi:L-glutamine-phosphate cytidylyltransferase